MLRITEIKLPLVHAETLKHQDDQIKAAILKRLEIPESELIRFEIFKRGVDARKSHAILYVYKTHISNPRRIPLINLSRPRPKVL
jgi:uncharacterized protein